jgi:hypothetical protein
MGAGSIWNYLILLKKNKAKKQSFWNLAFMYDPSVFRTTPYKTYKKQALSEKQLGR